MALKYYQNREVVIKTCLGCGHTQRLPYEKFICPKCDSATLAYFRDTNHLITFIDRYGLGKINIVDTDIRHKILSAFSV